MVGSKLNVRVAILRAYKTIVKLPLLHRCDISFTTDARTHITDCGCP